MRSVTDIIHQNERLFNAAPANENIVGMGRINELMHETDRAIAAHKLKQIEQLLIERGRA